MKVGELVKLGGALLLGVVVAFPVGMMVAGWAGRPAPAAPTGRPTAAVRDVFSPSLRRDPYFLEHQREGVEALERYCDRTGESCAEARAARRALDRLEAAH